MTKTETYFREALTPRSGDPPWRWAERYLDVGPVSPMPGKFRGDTAPWTKEPMEVAADNRIKQVVVKCAAQTGKTQMGIVLIAWAVDQDPGPAMWVMKTGDEAKTFSNTRLLPTLDACPPVASKMPVNRFEKKTLEVNFASMPLILNGADAPSKLQSKPIRWLFLDELRNYKPGAYEMVSKRTRAFWNSRKIIMSTPDMEDDHVDRAWQEGDQRIFEVACPSCGDLHEMEFENLKWETNDETYNQEKDVWNFEEVRKTVRYQFPCCQYEVKDRMDIRKRIAASGRFRKTNLNAPADKVSFRWSALLPPWVRWFDIVSEFLEAKAAINKGAIEPMKTFQCETLARPWKEELGEPEDIMALPVHDDTWPWQLEKHRFATIDVQKGYFYLVIRAWSDDGQSRLVHWEKVATFDGVDEVATRYDVKKHLVFMDCAHDTTKVIRHCHEYGWKPLWGSHQKSFTHKIKQKGKPVSIRRAFSPPVPMDPGAGTSKQGRLPKVGMRHWSNHTIKDILQRLRDGQGAEWLIYPNAGPDYTKQMFSEHKVEEVDRMGQSSFKWYKRGSRDNHIWDCECMQVVAALMARVLRDF